MRAAQGETVRYDEDICIAGGALITIDFQIAPLRDDEGTIVNLVPSGIDVTGTRDRGATISIQGTRAAHRYDGVDPHPADDMYALGIIAYEMTARAAPDGYTITVGATSSTVINEALYPKLPYSMSRDFVPVAPVNASARGNLAATRWSPR